MAQDTITWTGVRAPGVKRFRPLERWCISAPRPPTLNGDTTLQAARCTKDGCQPRDTKFLRRRRVNAPSDRPTFQPYWGKPAVRMIGGTMETAASYEARFAPWSYPTSHIHIRMFAVWPKQKGLPSLIYHEPVLEVKFMCGAAGTTRILTIRATGTKQVN
jgi:hypothetical protein